jgi:hypothetical protein
MGMFHLKIGFWGVEEKGGSLRASYDKVLWRII